MGTPINGAVSQSEARSVMVRIVTDPPGRTETPALPWVCVAIHLGRAVYMYCKRGGQKHSGLGVHADIDVIPAFIECVWEPKEEDSALVVAVNPDLVATVAEESGENGSHIEIRNRFQIRDTQMEHIGWALKAEMDMGYPNGRLFCDSLGTAIAAHLLNRHSSLAKLNEVSSAGMSGGQLKRVISFIEDQLARDLSLNEIAAVAGISASHFKFVFRKSVGQPVHQYIVRRRVEKAEQLLRTSKLPISQIAQITGFAHQSHLSHHMRRILGYSPMIIRSFAE
jgi:AraC family transcriptional regulator